MVVFTFCRYITESTAVKRYSSTVRGTEERLQRASASSLATVAASKDTRTARWELPEQAQPGSFFVWWKFVRRRRHWLGQDHASASKRGAKYRGIASPPP